MQPPSLTAGPTGAPPDFAFFSGKSALASAPRWPLSRSGQPGKWRGRHHPESGRRRSSQPHLSLQENPPAAPSRLAHVLGLQPGRSIKAPHPTGRGVPSRTHSPGRKNSLPAPPSSGTETGIGILRRGRATAPRPPGQIPPAGLTRAGTLPSPRPAQILPGNEYSVRRYLPPPSLEHLFYFRLDRRRQCMVGNVKR